MNEPNQKQIDGDHYKKNNYQHWDFVCDIELHYLLACSTKYVARWRNKNGVIDLQKSIHYLEKADERRVFAPELTDEIHDYCNKFIEQLGRQDGAIIMLIMLDDYDGAVHAIHQLIEEKRQELEQLEELEEKQQEEEIILARKRDGV